jgi:hypothetical protein
LQPTPAFILVQINEKRYWRVSSLSRPCLAIQWQFKIAALLFGKLNVFGLLRCLWALISQETQHGDQMLSALVQRKVKVTDLSCIAWKWHTEIVISDSQFECFPPLQFMLVD